MLEGSVNITATGSKEGQTEQLSTTDSVVFMGVEPGSRLAALVTEEQISLDDIEHIDAGKAALLGKGAFGEVRKVIWRKTPAAAKVCHESMPHQQKMLFLRELELMVRCRHPNIVQFLGYVDHPFIIVMEYLPAGDLRAYWQSRSLAVPHKTRICIDILRGLGYLHNRKPSSIIHRDIKPTNVLMTLSGVAKITDFGLSRLKQAGKAAADATPEAGRMRPTAVSTRTAPAYPVSSCEYHHDNTKEVGTVPYMAPEANMQGYDERWTSIPLRSPSTSSSNRLASRGSTCGRSRQSTCAPSSRRWAQRGLPIGRARSSSWRRLRRRSRRASSRRSRPNRVLAAWCAER